MPGVHRWLSHGQSAKGGWYISQFEMAYDRNIAGYNWQQFGFSWAFAFARTEDLLLNNVAAANKKLYLQKQGMQFTDMGSRGGPITGNMELQVKSVTGFNNLENVFASPVIDKL